MAHPTARSGVPWFLFQVRSGASYALYFMVIAFFMGAIYGAFGGLTLEPAFFSVSLVGIFCVLNFIVSVIATLLGAPLLMLRKDVTPLFRYFSLSLGFAVVYLTYFYLLHLLKLEVF